MSSGASKPWKQGRRKKKAQAAESQSGIEIYESKPASPVVPLLESTPADHRSYVRVVSKEDAEFFVPVKTIERFKCVDVILHGDAMFKEKQENVIRFPDLRSEVLESVLRFVLIDYLDGLKSEKYWGQRAPRVPFQFEVEPSQVMELVYAAHFFGIVNLLNVAAAMIAHHLREVPDVSSMPSDLAWCVAEHFSAQNLFEAEERADFLSLQLDTSALWKKHCEKLLQDSAIRPVSSDESYPDYPGWPDEGPPPTSWKSLYVSTDVQQLADKQDGSTNKTLLEEVSRKGRWVYNHAIRPTMWEWVISGEESLSFNTYAACFPNLLSLSLPKVPLRKHLAEGNVDFGLILEGMPSLKLLDLSETGFTAEAAVRLSGFLKLHKGLQVLRIAYNRIGSDGYSAIVEVLPFARNLKVLDVRDNGIGIAFSSNAAKAMEACSLEELLVDGNCGEITIISASDYLICSVIPPTLRCLKLQQCHLKDLSVRLLTRALHSHTSIQKIDLSDNRITSCGAQELFKWLQGNGSLLEMNLAYNNITETCSGELRIALENHPCLEKFSLMGNYSYGEDTLAEIILAAQHHGNVLLACKQMKFTLDLRSTDVSFAHRARLQRQSATFVSLDLKI